MIAALLVAQIFAAGALTLRRNDDVLDVGLIPVWGALGFIEVAARRLDAGQQSGAVALLQCPVFAPRAERPATPETIDPR
jgi:hypothetical protein